MIKNDIKLEGIKDIETKLKYFNFENAISRSIRESIILLYGEIIKATPVDTGLLRGSHRIKIEENKGEIINTRYYGIFVHEGTIKQKAQPWMTETLQKNYKYIESIFNRNIEKEINNKF